MILRIEIDLAKEPNVAGLLQVLSETLPDALDMSKPDFTELASNDGGIVIGKASVSHA
jgi:hypothetical protein